MMKRGKKLRRSFYVYLFRHGQTTFNRDGRFTGWLDPGVTKLGTRHARIIARKLRRKKFQVAFYTRLKRSKQTLKEVLKFHPECKKLIRDDRMIERNYGKLNGTTHEDFIKKMGKKLYDLEVHGDLIGDLSKEGRREVERALGEEEFKLIHRGFYVPPPAGESFADVEKRVRSFVRDLIKIMKKQKVNVAISAHGNSIRLFRKIMEKASIPETTSWFIPYDKVFFYKVKI